VAALAAISLLALFDTFGQCSRTTLEQGATATLSLQAPTRLRGGLVFTPEIVVMPTTDLRNGRIFLGRGWFQGMSVNTIEPSPSGEFSSGPWVILSFGPMQAGRAFHLWLSLQVNPTNVGSHGLDVALYDGPVPIASVHRSLFVFP
jgi:hypothetical protein